MTVTSRGTSNSGLTGNSEDRRRRKHWLLETYRADVDIFTVREGDYDAITMLGMIAEAHGPGSVSLLDVAPSGDAGTQLWTVPLGEGEVACRCFRCGRLLTYTTLECDRIVSGKRGGRYVRENIRPVCGTAHLAVGGGCNQWLGHREQHGNPPVLRHHVNGQS